MGHASTNSSLVSDFSFHSWLVDPVCPFFVRQQIWGTYKLTGFFSTCSLFVGLLCLVSSFFKLPQGHTLRTDANSIHGEARKYSLGIPRMFSQNVLAVLRIEKNIRVRNILCFREWFGNKECSLENILSRSQNRECSLRMFCETNIPTFQECLENGNELPRPVSAWLLVYSKFWQG